MQLTIDNGQLTTGWQIKKLGDISKINYGYTAKASFEKAGLKFLRITDIQNDSVNWENVPYCRIDEANIQKYQLLDGDIVFARTGATTGKSYLVKDPPQSVAASYLIRLRLNDSSAYPEFIAKYFQTFEYWNAITSGMSGSAQGGFNASKLSSLVVPLPSLKEQKRIVAILDEAFEGCDRAIANTEKNLANAREIFESYLNAIFTQKGDDWIENIFSEVGGKVFTGPFGSLLHKSDYVEDGIPVVNPANIEGDVIIPDRGKTVNDKTLERLGSYVLEANNIVIGRRGEIGRCAVIEEDQNGWLCGTGCFFIKTHENVNPTFLAHLIRSEPYRKRLEALSTGATMKNLNNKSLSNFVIALPPRRTQNHLIASLDDLSRETQCLEAIYQRKLEALQELKQSILHKAFTGELTNSTTEEVAV